MKSLQGRLPSLNSLKAFEVAARRLSFTLAAEELGVTQGAVAQQVRGLEAALGLKLFERLPRALELTAEGRGYVADIRRAFEIIGRATDSLLPHPFRLTISTTPTFASKWLIPRLPDFTVLHPALDLHILATERVSNFRSDSIDLAVRYGQPPFGSGLATELLFKQEIVAVCSPKLFDGEEPPRTVEELTCYPLLHDTHNFWPEFIDSHLGHFEQMSFKGISFNQTSHAIEAAIAGQGIVLANRHFVESDISAGRLVAAVDGVLRGHSDFYLIWPRHRKLPSLETLIVWLLEQVRRN